MGAITEVRSGTGRASTRGRIVRGAGWLLIAVGTLILLYLVYSMFFTNVLNERSQNALLEQWELQYGTIDDGVQVVPPGTAPSDTGGEPSPVEVGDAYAVMWFERPGTDERPVYGEPLSVVEGIDPASLKLGPGHYPDTAAPGQPGNFAIAGHRTTYGAPFYDLDQIRSGDEIHVIDRGRRRWVYEVVDRRVVLPHETWVIGPDPLGRGRPVLSLTTCEPRFSAEKRLMVFAELREPNAEAAAA